MKDAHKIGPRMLFCVLLSLPSLAKAQTTGAEWPPKVDLPARPDHRRVTVTRRGKPVNRAAEAASACPRPIGINEKSPAELKAALMGNWVLVSAQYCNMDGRFLNLSNPYDYVANPGGVVVKGDSAGLLNFTADVAAADQLDVVMSGLSVEGSIIRPGRLTVAKDFTGVVFGDSDATAVEPASKADDFVCALVDADHLACNATHYDFHPFWGFTERRFGFARVK